MAGFPGEWLEELKSKSNIVDVIGRYIPLTRKGRSFWGCCPFHHEKTPSFKADEDKQLFYCFGCKASGNVITFVEKIENVDFLDAVKHLAEKAGMQLPSLKSDAEVAALKERRDLIYRTLKAAAVYYNENLSKPGGGRAREYLEGRGVSPSMIKRFGLGVSLGWDGMVKYMLSKGFKHDILKDAGLAEAKDGRWYDVFGGRLIFPVINNWLSVVGFSGRILDNGSKLAKYRNSAQTAVFDKGKLLYGINLLRQKKQKEPVPHVIIVEGQMDVISLHQAGFDTAVACLGTALTASHARLIKNYCDKVYLCYDGDSAGQAATIRGLDILAGTGLEVRVMSLPDKLDPDELLKRRGVAAFTECMENALPLIEFKIAAARAGRDLNDSAQKAKYAVDAAAVIKKLANPVEQEEYLKIVKADTGYSMDSLKKQLENTESTPAGITENAAQNDGADMRVMFILRSRLMNEKYADAFDLSPYLEGGGGGGGLYQKIYAYIEECAASGASPNPNVLYDFIGADMQQALGDFLNYDFEMDEATAAKYYGMSKKKLQYERLLHTKNEISVKYENEKETGRRKALSMELSKLIAEEQKLKREIT